MAGQLVALTDLVAESPMSDGELGEHLPQRSLGWGLASEERRQPLSANRLGAQPGLVVGDDLAALGLGRLGVLDGTFGAGRPGGPERALMAVGLGVSADIDRLPHREVAARLSVLVLLVVGLVGLVGFALCGC